MLAQLLNQFHTTDQLNDPHQLQLNRSARYIHQDVNQFRSIENFDLPTQNDFLQYDELLYGNSGNEN